MSGGGYLKCEHETRPAYCGYCKKDVQAYAVELVIDNDPEPSHYECPMCERPIGGSRLGNFIKVVTIAGVIACLVVFVFYIAPAFVGRS